MKLIIAVAANQFICDRVASQRVIASAATVATIAVPLFFMFGLFLKFATMIKLGRNRLTIGVILTKIGASKQPHFSLAILKCLLYGQNMTLRSRFTVFT